jgi:glycosyltransferase involved in cell wall biosynthesis
MSNKGTFVILTPGFPKSEEDSTCLPMQQQFVKGLKEMYPKLDIIILAFQYPYHQKKYKWVGIDVIPFDGRNKGGLKKLWIRRKVNAILEELHRKNRIIGLFSFWYNECALVGKKFADDNHLKHYCWILGQDARKENKYPKQINLRQNALIALSDFLQLEFEKNHGIKPKFVIPPGIDPRLFNSSYHEKNIDILGAGSLISLKQYDIFLEIIAEVKKQIPKIKSVLIGKGPESKRLQAIIEESGLRNNISLTGELQYPEVLQQMQKAKVFLHPSSYEGFSGVCLEALYAGCQIISFCKPMSEDISHWHVVKTKDEMVEKTLEIMQDKAEYKSVKKFPINDTVSAIMKLYEEN